MRLGIDQLVMLGLSDEIHIGFVERRYEASIYIKCLDSMITCRGESTYEVLEELNQIVMEKNLKII